MTETTNNVPTKTQNTPAPQQARRRFAGIRREIDSLVEDFFRRPPSPVGGRSCTLRPGVPERLSVRSRLSISPRRIGPTRSPPNCLAEWTRRMLK
jgi:hypothetical protein